MSLCEPVQTTLAFPQNGLALHSNGVGLKLAQQMMPLSSLLDNDNNNNNNFSPQPDVEETPILSYGDAMQVKKNEDFAFAKANCQRVPGDESSTFSAFAVQLLQPTQSILSHVPWQRALFRAYSGLWYIDHSTFACVCAKEIYCWFPVLVSAIPVLS